MNPASNYVGFLTVFPGLVLPMFLSSVDQTIVATALPAVARDLQSITSVSWVVISYLLFQTVSAPIYGRLSDLYGRRRMLMVALGILVGASVLCAFSTSLGMLIFARGLQGCGGGGLQTMVQSIIGEATPPRERGKNNMYLTVVYASSSALGPVIGGYLSQIYTWRAIFWFQLPLGIIGFLLAARLPRLGGTGARGASFDYLGTVMFIVAAISCLLGLTKMGHGQNANFTFIGGLFVVGIGFGVAFLRYEKRVASPLIPLAVIAEPTVWRTSLAGACYSATNIGLINFVPLYLQLRLGFDSSRSGSMMIVLTIAATFAAMTGGYLISRTGYLTRWTLIGLPFYFAGVIGLAITTGFSHAGWFVAGLLLLLGLGGGAILPMTSTLIQSAAKASSLGSASSALIFGRAIGSAIGTAIVSTAMLASLSVIDPHASGLVLQLLDQGPQLMARFAPAERDLVNAHLGAAFAIAFCVLSIFPLLTWWMVYRIPITRMDEIYARGDARK